MGSETPMVSVRCRPPSPPSPPNGLCTPLMGSGTPIVTVRPPQQTQVFLMHSGTPILEGETPRLSSWTPTMGSGTPMVGVRSAPLPPMGTSAGLCIGSEGSALCGILSPTTG